MFKLRKSIIGTMLSMCFLSTVGNIQAEESQETAPFDLNEAVAMEAFLRGVAYKCLPEKMLESFISGSKRQVVFAAQEMKLSKSLYEQLERDIEEKISHPFFEQITILQCQKHSEELVLLNQARNQTLDALEDVLKEPHMTR